jgi:hypothetical protein
MKKETIAVWFSCGAASAVAAKKILEKYGESHNILIVNNPVVNEHPDNERFLKDCEKWFGVEILKATNKNYPSCDIRDVFAKRKYMVGVDGAPCTKQLKKEARYQFELSHQIDWHVLGFTLEEKNRSERFIKFERGNVIPILIDLKITKKECFRIVQEAGIKLPEIYSFGFPNANCIGCVKSAAPKYWNLVRETFPEVFKERADQSREIGVKLVKIHAKYLPYSEKIGKLYFHKETGVQLSSILSDGKISHTVRIHLDDLPANFKKGKIESWECGIFCDTK